jgi:hypothetical protein
MVDQNMSGGSASALAGYGSVSQFNREYKRLFGSFADGYLQNAVSITSSDLCPIAADHEKRCP